MRESVIKRWLILTVLIIASCSSVFAQTKSTSVKHQYENEVEAGQVIIQTESNGIYLFEVSEPQEIEVPKEILGDQQKINFYDIGALNWNGQEMFELDTCVIQIPSENIPRKVILFNNSMENESEIPFVYEDGKINFTMTQTGRYGIVVDEYSDSDVVRGINNQYIRPNYHSWIEKVILVSIGGILLFLFDKRRPHLKWSDKLDV